VSARSSPVQRQAQPIAANDRRFQRAVTAMRENRPETTEVLVRQFLDEYPNDVNGL